jgi:phosphatidylserine/phosphatidylglycerophosphate/cardiolipin synthase-like enzyme
MGNAASDPALAPGDARLDTTGVTVEALGNNLEQIGPSPSPGSANLRSGQRFVSYRFELRRGGEQWRIRRRFNDFVVLDHQLKGSVTALPGRGFGRSFEPGAIQKRQQQLTSYLQTAVQQPHLWQQSALREFCAVSAHSFAPSYGVSKGAEGWCRKASGNSAAGRFAQFKRRWIVAKDCFIAWFASPDAGAPLGVLLVDADLEVHEGEVANHPFSLHVSCGERSLTLQFSCAVEQEDWRASLLALYAPSVCPRREHEKPCSSFAPLRDSCQATMHVGGRELYSAMAHAIWTAQSQIFIAGWIFNANLLLVRPPDASAPVRLDELLAHKAAQGVQVHILLYREVSDAHQPNKSKSQKEFFEALHPTNVHVMRHPWHFNVFATNSVYFSHHEKLLIVDQQLAFAGGIDLAHGRWDDDRHELCAHDEERYPWAEFYNARWRAKAPLSAAEEEAASRRVANSSWGGGAPPAAAVPPPPPGPSNAAAAAAAAAAAEAAEAAPPLSLSSQVGVGSHGMAVLGQEPPPSCPPGVDAAFFAALPAEIQREYAAAQSRLSEEAAGAGGAGAAPPPPPALSPGGAPSPPVPQLSGTVGADIRVKAALQGRGGQPLQTEKKKKKKLLLEAGSGAEQVLRKLWEKLGVDGDHGDAAAAMKPPPTLLYRTARGAAAGGWASGAPTLVGDLGSLYDGEDLLLAHTLLQGGDEDSDSAGEEGLFGGAAAPTMLGAPSCPADMDASVFASLPLDIQQELAADGQGAPAEEQAGVVFEGKAAALGGVGAAAAMPAMPAAAAAAPFPAAHADDYSELLFGADEPLFGAAPAPARALSEAQLSPMVPAGAPQVVECDGAPRPRRNSHLSGEAGPLGDIVRGIAAEKERVAATPLAASFGGAAAAGALPGRQWNSAGGAAAPPVAGSTAAAAAAAARVKDSHTPAAHFSMAPTFVPLMRTEVPRQPWHDTHLCFTGGAAKDAAFHFMQRWEHHRRQKGERDKQPVLLPHSDRRLPPRALPAPSLRLANGRSVPILNPSEQGSCSLQVLRSAGYWSLAKPIETSILNMYVKLVREARHCVYIENQFFISSVVDDARGVENTFVAELLARLRRAIAGKETFRVAVLLPLHPEGSLADPTVQALMDEQLLTLDRGPSSLLGTLQREFPDDDLEEYIFFFSLRSWARLPAGYSSEMTYVHTKMLIVDDKTVVVGSANINDRSLLGSRDTEVAVAVHDRADCLVHMDGKAFSGSVFAHTLRRRLWREHLGATDLMADCQDAWDSAGREQVEMADPTCSETWTALVTTARTNASLLCRALDEVADLDSVSTIAECDRYVCLGRLSRSDLPDDEKAELLAGVKGRLIPYPRNFLNKQALGGMMINGAVGQVVGARGVFQ